jgi:hypothetical protein
MSEVYEVVLIVHSFIRWWVLVACASTAVYGLWPRQTGARSSFNWRVGRGFVASVDLQVLLGLTLYFGVSPLARAARTLWAEQGFDALWTDRMLRFFGVIHPCLALLAACAAHAGWVSVRRVEDEALRRRRLGAVAALALAIFLAAVPWPFLGHERPWFRLWS